MSRVGAGTLAPCRAIPKAGPTSRGKESSTHLALSLCPCKAAAGGVGERGGARLRGTAWPKEYTRWAPGRWGLTPSASSRSRSTLGQVFATKMAAGSLLCKPPVKLEQREEDMESRIQLQGGLGKCEEHLRGLKAVLNWFAKESFAG